jgi:nitric oxide reductase NorD protein
MTNLTEALNAGALEERMDVYLDPALSSRRTASRPARDLAGCGRAEQDFVLHWGAVIARDNAELAYQFTANAREALRVMDLEAVESWLLYAMDLYDKQGQTPAIRALQEAGEFATNLQEKLAVAVLEDVSGVLERFIRGLNGRALTIAQHERCFTDTETIHLPPVVGRLADKQGNFRLYKAMAVHQWAQNWYGTWRGEVLLRAFESGDLAASELALFHAIETIRLDACLARDLPGLHRDMVELRRLLDHDNGDLQRQAAALTEPGTSVAETLALMSALRDLGDRMPQAGSCCYRGELDPAAVRDRLDIRAVLERDRFRIALAKLVQDVDGAEPATEARDDDDRPDTIEATRDRIKARRREDPDAPDGVSCQLLLDGKSVAPPEDVLSTMESIIQDLGEIPPEYLVAAGPGLSERDASDQDKDPNSVRAGAYHEEGTFLYDEWDCGRRHHRKGWCVLRERPLRPADLTFFQHTLCKYGGLIKSIRRTFEVLRGEDKTLKRQMDGEDLDIDALVEAHADVRAGMEMTDRLFLRTHKHERSVAVMLMVDMSGSTKGWINEAEREALILLAEALITLGDRFAIYGFSGWTRKRCEVYPIKRFDQAYDDDAKAWVRYVQHRRETSCQP